MTVAELRQALLSVDQDTKVLIWVVCGWDPDLELREVVSILVNQKDVPGVILLEEEN